MCSVASSESAQVVKKLNDPTKKSPLKVVGPIIKKYTGHRQGKLKSKRKFQRVFCGGRSKQKSVSVHYKTILPKTDAGNIIILEPELLPCALNLLKRKKNEDDSEAKNELPGEPEQNSKALDNSHLKESSNRFQKPRVLASNKKKLKCLKNLEASLELLESNTSPWKEKREQAFVENYLLRVQEKLKGDDENVYNEFLDLICNFQSNRMSVCDMYKRVKYLLAPHADLVEDFVAFLTPEQAVECGVFMDHLLITAMFDFLSKIDIYFAKSPQQVKKIHSVLESLISKPYVTADNVIGSVLPLLKGNPILSDYFVQLIPNMRPPDYFYEDYEEVEYSEMNSDVSDEEDIVEIVHLPEMEDLYGGDLCPCRCHDEKLSSTLTQHCLLCSVKFINGKIFIQNGKLLRPAKVVFDDHDLNYHRERLAPKLYPKRAKKRQRHNASKDNLSPTKSCNLSSDEFKSDIEEEERNRMKCGGALKSPRGGGGSSGTGTGSSSNSSSRKKSASPKHCDKNLAKCIFPETKAEPNSDEKPAVDVKSIFIFDKGDGTDSNLAMGCCNLGTTYSSKIQNDPQSLRFPDADAENENKDGEEKLLDLPKIIFEEEEGVKEEKENAKSERVQFVSHPSRSLNESEEEIHSPPVISIPESDASLFVDSKPIYSLLEDLDDSKSELINLIAADKSEFRNSEPHDGRESEEKSGAKMADDDDYLPWKIEEDRIILQTLQIEKNCEETFVKIAKNIPNRTVQDIKNRFANLMDMLYEMKAQDR